MSRVNEVESIVIGNRWYDGTEFSGELYFGLDEVKFRDSLDRHFDRGQLFAEAFGEVE